MAAIHPLLLLNSLAFSWACQTGDWSGFDQVTRQGFGSEIAAAAAPCTGVIDLCIPLPQLHIDIIDL